MDNFFSPVNTDQKCKMWTCDNFFFFWLCRYTCFLKCACDCWQFQLYSLHRTLKLSDHFIFDSKRSTLSLHTIKSCWCEGHNCGQFSWTQRIVKQTQLSEYWILTEWMEVKITGVTVCVLQIVPEETLWFDWEESRLS